MWASPSLPAAESFTTLWFSSPPDVFFLGIFQPSCNRGKGHREDGPPLRPRHKSPSATTKAVAPPSNRTWLSRFLRSGQLPYEKKIGLSQRRIPKMGPSPLDCSLLQKRYPEKRRLHVKWPTPSSNDPHSSPETKMTFLLVACHTRINTKTLQPTTRTLSPCRHDQK